MKVKVRKDIYEALQSYEQRKGDLFKAHLNYDVYLNENLLENEKILRTIRFTTLIDIAYCGYELEETKGDKLIRFYNTKFNSKSLFSLGEEIAYKQGIIDCYEILQENSFPFK